jgi:hypothetical protein
MSTSAFRSAIYLTPTAALLLKPDRFSDASKERTAKKRVPGSTPSTVIASLAPGTPGVGSFST